MGKGSKPIQPQSEKKPPAQASSHVHVPAPAAAGVLETATTRVSRQLPI
jgi:hypothetical protein